MRIFVILGGREATALIKLFSRNSLFLLFILIRVSAEKEASHKYVDPKGNSYSKAFFLSSGFYFFTHTQNCVIVNVSNFISSPRSDDTSKGFFLMTVRELHSVCFRQEKWISHPVKLCRFFLHVRKVKMKPPVMLAK